MSDPPSAYIVNPYEVGGSPKVKPCVPQGIGRGGRKGCRVRSGVSVDAVFGVIARQVTNCRLRIVVIRLTRNEQT